MVAVHHEGGSASRRQQARGSAVASLDEPEARQDSGDSLFGRVLVPARGRGAPAAMCWLRHTTPRRAQPARRRFGGAVDGFAQAQRVGFLPLAAGADYLSGAW